MAKKLPYQTFLETFELAPRAAISLLIKNTQGNILLTKRLKPPFANYWHLPGSFIIKNEAINECIKRILKEELGVRFVIPDLIGDLDSRLRGNDMINIKTKHKLLGVFENLDKDPRGHVIDIIYAIKLNRTAQPKPIGYTKEVEFFKKLPTNIGFNHHETLAKLGYK